MSEKQPSIERSVTFRASVEKVWDAITDPQQLSQWFGQSAKFDLQPGSQRYFGWDSHGQFALRIEAVQPMTFFSWR